MLNLSAGFPAASALFRASILTGEPLIFPTDTIYGMGAPIASIKANRKVFTIKKRPEGKPMPLLVGSLKGLLTVAEDISDDVRQWLSTLWPGPYTIIFKARPWVDPLYTLNGTVAVRMVGGWLGQAIDAVGSPVSATSVNESGSKPMYGSGEIYMKYKDSVSFMLCGKSGQKQSQIIDISTGGTEIIRDV